MLATSNAIIILNPTLPVSQWPFSVAHSRDVVEVNATQARTSDVCWSTGWVSPEAQVR